MQAEVDVLKLNHSRLEIGLLSILGAATLTLALFLLVPITQEIDKPDYEKKIIEMQKPIRLAPPPPPPKTLPKVEKIQKSSLPKPKLKQTQSITKIQGLNVDLNIGLGVDLAVGDGFGEFETEVNVTQQIKELFTFKDLDTPPRYVSLPKFTFPRELERRGIKSGQVTLYIEINTDGRAQVLKVISSTHARLESEAINIVRKAKFTTPLVDGKPNKVLGDWTINLNAN